MPALSGSCSREKRGEGSHGIGDSVYCDLPGPGRFFPGQGEGQDSLGKFGLDGSRVQIRVQAQLELVVPGLGRGAVTGPVPGGREVTFPCDDKQVVLQGDGEGVPGDTREGDVKSDALVFPGYLVGRAGLGSVMRCLVELCPVGI